jgi:hypothetical protein
VKVAELNSFLKLFSFLFASILFRMTSVKATLSRNKIKHHEKTIINAIPFRYINWNETGSIKKPFIFVPVPKQKFIMQHRNVKDYIDAVKK